MKNKKSTIIIIFILIIVLAIVVVLNKNYISSQDNNSKIAEVNIFDETTNQQIQELNERLDQFYIETWETGQYISYYSYLADTNKNEVTLQDVSEALQYQIPEKLSNIAIHFVKPKSLKTYLGDKILDEDLEILTVYSAIPVDNGIFISSKFDEGGIISEEEYRQFVLEHSWIHGDIITPVKGEKEYEEILNAVIEKDYNLQESNVKHIVCDEKYAIIVISSSDLPSYIKQYALQKNEDETWSIIVEGLEKYDSKIYINYAYTDFSLYMLPQYEISSFQNITSDLTNIIDIFKDAGYIDENEEAIYSCGAGNFYYVEFSSGLKELFHINSEGTTDLYTVDSSTTALYQMFELEQNPPIFILNL